MADGHPAANGGPPAAAECGDTTDTVEFRLMMAYAQRRRPQDTRLVVAGGGAPSPVPASVEEVETKKKKKNRLLKAIRWLLCVPKEAEAAEPQGDNGTSSMFRNGGVNKNEEEVQTSKGVDELIKLAGVSFIPETPEIETDSEEDDIEKLAGLLLRECGDDLQAKHDLSQLFTLLHNYSLFKQLMSYVFLKIGFKPSDAGHQGPKDSKTKIAVTCEVASRLSAVDTLPMSQVLGFGARYLKEHYSVEEALNVAEETESDVE
ncbi:unnamed protein product [Merluccius merluccius]